MKEIKQVRPKLPYQRTYLTVMALVIFLPAIWFGFSKFVDWNEKHYFQKQDPITLKVQAPIVVREREEVKVVEKPLVLEYPEEIDTPLEKYICEKFGTFECKTALAVSLAENGTRQADRFNINTNNTIDVGIFQINSVHFEKEGCALFQIVDPIQNVNCAYTIWQASGWGAWVAHNNGAYLAKLDK